MKSSVSEHCFFFLFFFCFGAYKLNKGHAYKTDITRTKLGSPAFRPCMTLQCFQQQFWRNLALNITLQDLFSKISAKIWCFFGFKHNFHQHLMYVAYAYHTWMESCACQLNFDTKMSGLAYVPREQGILLTVEKNPGPQPDTASYTKCACCTQSTF